MMIIETKIRKLRKEIMYHRYLYEELTVGWIL